MEVDMEKLYLSALSSWLEESHCVLPHTMFALAMSHDWRGCWSLASQLSVSSFSSSVRMFRKVAAVGLLSNFLGNKTMVKEHREQVVKVAICLSKNVVQQLENVCVGVGKTKPKFLTELFNILFKVKDFDLEEEIDWVKTEKVLALIANNWPDGKHFIEAKRSLNRLARKCKIQVEFVLNSQENNENINIEKTTESTDTKKKSKKKSNKALKQTKAMKLKMAEAQENVGVPSSTEFVS